MPLPPGTTALHNVMQAECLSAAAISKSGFGVFPENRGMWDNSICPVCLCFWETPSRVRLGRAVAKVHAPATATSQSGSAGDVQWRSTWLNWWWQWGKYNIIIRI